MNIRTAIKNLALMVGGAGTTLLAGVSPAQTGANPVPLPNITHVFYGRDVGYVVERIELDSSVEAVSATEVRRRLSDRPTKTSDV